VRFSAKYLPFLWRLVLYQISKKSQQENWPQRDTEKIQLKRKKPQELFGVVQKSISDEFSEAQKLIAGDEALYFLGFGYNQTNMERLGIETLRIPSKKIGTIFKLGFQEIQEVRRMNIFSHLPTERLFNVPVYEFLYKHVDFNSL